jgi:predicted nucleotidyltransferase
VTLFKKEGIVENGKVKSNEAIVKALKILFNVNMLYTTSSISKIAEIKPAAAGLYGSWANGSNDEESDVDIWIRIKKRPREDSIALLSNELGKKLGRSVHILLLTDEKLAILKAKDQVFYHSLAFGSIILLGDQIE